MKKRFFSLTLALLMLLTILPAHAKGLSVQDMAGRDIQLTDYAKRIVALQPSDCEILYAIGAGDLLVGRGEYCDFPEEVKALPSVQSGFETNLEQIIELKPDVVIMTKMGQQEEHVTKLDEAGVKVIVTDAQNIEGVYQAIALLGRVSGHADEGDQLVTQMKETFEEYAKMAEGKEGGSVYFEVSPLEYGLWSAGANTFMDEIATILNLKNAFSDIQGWQAISEEQVISRDPDLIVTTAMYFGEGKTPVEEVVSRTGWEQLKAVKDGKVFNVNADAITRPGPRLMDAVRELYELVYDEAEAQKAA